LDKFLARLKETFPDLELIHNDHDLAQQVKIIIIDFFKKNHLINSTT